MSELLGYAEAARLIPELTGHPAVSPATIRRWVICGVRGPTGARVKLAAIRSGGRRYVSVEAVKEFVRACNGGTEPAIQTTRSRSLTMAERRQRAKRLYGTRRS